MSFDLSVKVFDYSDRDGFVRFVHSLENGDIGVSLRNNNLYMLMGMSFRGISEHDIDRVLAKVDGWCVENDARHPDGWILLTNGDTDYGYFSIETVASHIAKRGVPVVFIQSKFEQLYPLKFPTYACMGLVGEGKIGFMNGGIVPVWGGRVRDERRGPLYEDTGMLSFPDEVLTAKFGDSDVCLADNFGGILIVGGGNITREQSEIYRFLISGRVGDLYIRCNDRNGKASIMTSLHPNY